MKILNLAFQSNVVPVVSKEKDKYLSLASLETLKQYLPDIDAEKNIDLLPVAFSAFVANRFNKNGHGIDGPTAISIANNFKNKYINVEHNRKSVIGVILSSTFTEFGTENPLKEEDIKESTKPFNVTLGGVIWRVVDENITNKIEESNDPTSEYYKKISASWEIGFDNYNLVLIKGSSRNLEDGKIIDNPEEIKLLEKHLKMYGGTGKIDDDTYVYLLAKGDGVLPLGIGFTERPAADVSGIAVDIEKEEDTEDKEKSNSSQITIDNVKIDKTMKIKFNALADITDEALKQVSASDLIDFIREEIAKSSESWQKEKVEKETALAEALKAKEVLEKSVEEIKTQLENTNKQLEAVKATEAEREKLMKFSARMAELDNKYNLSEEERKVIASDIKDLSDESFNTYTEKMKIFLKTKEEKKQEVVASVNEGEKISSQSNIDNVIDNGKKDATSVPNTSTNEPTLKEKYAKAFDPDTGFTLE